METLACYYPWVCIFSPYYYLARIHPVSNYADFPICQPLRYAMACRRSARPILLPGISCGQYCVAKHYPYERFFAGYTALDFTIRYVYLDPDVEYHVP